LDNNEIDKIELNDFKGLNSLEYLYLNSNFILSIQAKSFELNIKLTELYLQNNQIISISTNTFYGLLSLKFLNLSNNSISKIEPNGFNNSLMKILYLPIKNITVDSFCHLKDSFKVRQVPNKTFLNYYDTVYIENPFDNDCSKLLISMKSKIYYNFLNEHILLEGYLNGCNNNTILREAIIKYKCINNNLENNSKRSYSFNLIFPIIIFNLYNYY
jgi:Leucine-rich repeat (LRR) protein